MFVRKVPIIKGTEFQLHMHNLDVMVHCSKLVSLTNTAGAVSFFVLFRPLLYFCVLRNARVRIAWLKRRHRVRVRARQFRGSGADAVVDYCFPLDSSPSLHTTTGHQGHFVRFVLLCSRQWMHDAAVRSHAQPAITIPDLVVLDNPNGL